MRQATEQEYEQHQADRCQHFQVGGFGTGQQTYSCALDGRTCYGWWSECERPDDFRDWEGD